MATYDLTSSIPAANKLAAGDILNCPYSGTYKQIVLPKGQYKLEVWGAEGGYRHSDNSYSGKGGYSIGILTLAEKTTTLYLYAGGAGNTAPGSATIKVGGFNGGGYRYQYNGGGGGSDVRIGSTSLYARVIVAGGGGSDGSTTNTGMYGGGESGGTSTANFGSYGYGGTQTGNSGGSNYITTSQPTTNGTSASSCYSGFGFGGMGVYRSSGYAGAGGGGWYGGTGSYPDSSGDDDRGGGGGSGYIYTSSTASNYPSGCLLNSSYYLANASMTAGNASMTSPTGNSETGHAGDGYVRITVILVKPYLINLLKYGNFENQGWIAGSNCSLTFDSSIKKYTNYSLKVSITRTNTGEAYFYQTVNPPMIQNHKYYVCCWIYLPTNSSATGMQVYWPEAEPLMGDMVADTTKINQWQKLSLIATRTNWSSGNQKFRFDIEGSISPNYVYIDGAMLIDLTDCYGEGKEPTKEWCDNNISFFMDGIKRQVITAKYIKINGEWKEI